MITTTKPAIELHDGMSKKEVAALSGISVYLLKKRLAAFAKTEEAKAIKFKWQGKERMEKAHVVLFLKHTDILTETITFD